MPRTWSSFASIWMTTLPTPARFLQKAQVNCVNLYTPGGLDSPLATYYGINAMPHLFLVGKDGKVINRTLQVGDLEIELRKAL